jgi:hypothetical protein
MIKISVKKAFLWHFFAKCFIFKISMIGITGQQLAVHNDEKLFWKVILI